MRGRLPKPTAIKIAEGNPGKRRLNEREPQPDAGLPECPDHLDAEARNEWGRIGRALSELGLLTKVDRAALAAYCQLWSRWVDAEIKVRENGMVVTTAQGNLIQNPYLGVCNTCLKLLRQYLVEFGLTPSSRCRLSVPTGDDDADALGDFMRLAE